MDVRYKCRCMANEVTIDVHDREEGEDVVDWMKGCVVVEVSLDHGNRSPLCQERKMEYVKLPYDSETGRIG